VASHSELMRLHIEALFVHDAEQCMVRVNEPNGALAPTGTLKVAAIRTAAAANDPVVRILMVSS